MSDDSDLDALKERRKELMEQLTQNETLIAQATMALLLICLLMWYAFGNED